MCFSKENIILKREKKIHSENKEQEEREKKIIKKSFSASTKKLKKMKMHMWALIFNFLLKT